MEGNDKIDGPFEFLSFIQRYHLRDSDPNIVILISCCASSLPRLRAVSALSPYLNYLRPAMSQTRLTDLTFLSTEKELADGLNFETVTKKTWPKEKRGKFVSKFLTNLIVVP